jgi:tripartite-type tricarboxylate transporter receptor subunit TctC
MTTVHAWADALRRSRTLGLTFGSVLGGLLVAAVLSGALGQTANYPNRAVKIIVAGAPDLFARVIAEPLQQAWRQPVVVEPRPGGGGRIGYSSVVSAEPDGHTMLYITPTFTSNPAMKQNNYDILKEVEPAGWVGIMAYVLVVNPSVPAKSAAELVALAKANPGTINCGSGGVGTAPHLACEAFSRFTGGEVVHVPFRDVNAVMAALVGGHVQMHFAVATVARQQIPSGTIRALAVLSAERSAILPDVPTMAESGFPEFVMPGWGGLAVTGGTPKPTIEIINASLQQVIQRPEIRDKLWAVGMEPPPPSSLAQFREFIRNDIARWVRIVDAIGLEKLKLDGTPK